MAPQPRCVDPAEENDADDEGEIWYNPIPEDDEPEMSHRSAVRLLVPPRREPQAPQRRPSRGGDVGQGGRALEGPCSAVPEAPGVSLGGGGSGGGGSGGDGSQGNAVHSTEALHLHRQMLACKPQEEGGPSASRLAGKKHNHMLPLTLAPLFLLVNLPSSPFFCLIFFSSFVSLYLDRCLGATHCLSLSLPAS